MVMVAFPSLTAVILPSNQTELISIGAYILGNTMSPGMKQVITITPYPVNAYVEQGFKYESSDASVASVDERGVITAVRDGNALMLLLYHLLLL